MDADHHVLPVADLSLDERDVGLAIERALEGNGAELAVIGRQLRGGDAAHQRLGADAVLDQVRDGNHQQLVPAREPGQLGNARHRAVGIENLADDAGRVESRDAREIHRRFGLPGAHQHAAVARLQREHVPGTCKIGRTRLRIDGGKYRGGAIRRGDAGTGDVLRLDRDAEGGLEARGVLRHHLRDVELFETLLRHRHADQAAALGGHEVDDLGRDLLGGDGEVSLVLAVLVVDDDDHPAFAEGLDGVLDRRKRRTYPAGLLRHALDPARVTSSARNTYLPIMSNSRFTRSLTLANCRLVCSHVYGTICTSKRRSSTPATVRLIPSTAIDPFLTIWAASEGGNFTVTHQ